MSFKDEIKISKILFGDLDRSGKKIMKDNSV